MKLETKKYVAFALLFICASVAMFWLTHPTKPHDRSEFYAYQADAFLHGRLDIPIAVITAHQKYTDLTPYQEKWYFSPAPLPSVLLMPLVAVFGPDRVQVVFQYALIPLAACLAFLLFKRRGLDATGSRWLVFALLFGSVFFGVCILIDYIYLAHLVALVFALAALLEHEGHNRPWLTGILVAGACASRSTAGLALVIFFAVDIVLKRTSWQQRVRQLSVFLLPIIVISAALLAFNNARFGNPLDFGYRKAILGIEFERNRRELYGIFNPRYIGENVWNLLLATPYWNTLPNNTWIVPTTGISFFIVAPIFLWIFLLRGWTRERIAILIACAMTTFLLLCYFCTGVDQYGPRYFNDILPLLLLLLVDVFKQYRMTGLEKSVLVASAGINVLLGSIMTGKYY